MQTERRTEAAFGYVAYRAVQYIFIIMQVLSFTFRFLSLCGIWLPVDWESKKHLRILYRLFSIVIVCIVLALTFLEGALITMSEFDMNYMTDILFTLLTAFSICGKIVNVISRRKKIIQLADMLLHRYCLPGDPEEIRMEAEVKEFIRMFTIVLNGLAQGTLYCLLMKPVFQESGQRELPYQMWLPYDLSDSRNFWWTWFSQIGLLIICICLNATVDILVIGFVLQACLQFDILRHRLYRLLEILKNPLEREQFSKESIKEYEERTFSQAVHHHNHIIRYTQKITETFDLIIVQQFISSALVLSVIVYKLSRGNIPQLQKIMAIGYFICMLCELFSFCWFGNELTLKSIKFGDDIYKLDWTLLSNKSKKDLMFIMLRSSRPILMCYGSLIIMNIESFKSILKVTYSVFNILKESSTT